MLQYTPAASDDMARLHSSVDAVEFRELVRRLVLLETSASAFDAMFAPVVDPRSGATDQVGLRTVHVLETKAGTTFVLVFRLSLVHEDVLVERLGYGG